MKIIKKCNILGIPLKILIKFKFKLKINEKCHFFKEQK